MRLTAPLAVVALTLTLGACMTRGNGEPASEVRKVEAFDKIDVGGIFELQAEQTSAQNVFEVPAEPAGEHYVEVRGDANLLPLVDVEAKGGRLRANMHGNVIPDLPLVLIVRTPTLREVELSGAARGEVKGIDGDSLEIEVSGASSLKLAGRVKRLDVDVSGASDVAAAGLVADAVEVESSGASNAEVTANASITADASGASSIVWLGTATQIDRDASGASSIEHR